MRGVDRLLFALIIFLSGDTSSYDVFVDDVEKYDRSVAPNVDGDLKSHEPNDSARLIDGFELKLDCSSKPDDDVAGDSGIDSLSLSGFSVL